jgi:hypothetical protein
MKVTEVVLDSNEDEIGYARHNGDWSGDVTIEHIDGTFIGKIPFTVMQQLVAEKIRQDAVRRLEDIDCWDIIDRLKM